MGKITKYALLNSLATVLYIFIVGSFMRWIEQGGFGDIGGIFGPAAFLMLLVFSVAFVGTAIFGRPVMWYIDGKKKDALALLGWTLGIFLLITVVVLVVVFGFAVSA